MSSSSSAERAQAVRAFESVAVGDVVAGFRLDRFLGRGETGAVYEATQLSMGRTVALRLIDPAHLAGADARAKFERELRLASSVHHDGLVSLFETGEWEGGRFIAMRLIRGRSLSAHAPDGGRAGEELLKPVSGALEAAHRAKLTHGAVREGNVLVDGDGRAYLADLGLGRGAGEDADREGLAAIGAAVGTFPASRRRRPMALIAACIALLAGLAVAAALLVGSGSGEERTDAEAAAPSAPEGTVPIGSDLSPGPAGTVGCGEGFGGGSSCILVLGGTGGVLRATEPGAIRSWAVRGASGELTLQVLRTRNGQPEVAGFSQPADATGPGPHRFPADIGLDRGELIAVRLGPGAALGRRDGGGGALRWEGAGLPLPELSEAKPIGGELLVRVDVEPGATASATPQLVGRRAENAAAGEVLADTSLALSARSGARVRLVRVDGGIVVDSFRGARRTARVTVVGADPEGELLRFDQACGYPRSVCVHWRNPDEATPLIHAYSLAPSGRFRVLG